MSDIQKTHTFLCRAFEHKWKLESGTLNFMYDHVIREDVSELCHLMVGYAEHLTTALEARLEQEQNAVSHLSQSTSALLKRAEAAELDYRREKKWREAAESRLAEAEKALRNIVERSTTRRGEP